MTSNYLNAIFSTIVENLESRDIQIKVNGSTLPILDLKINYITKDIYLKGEGYNTIKLIEKGELVQDFQIKGGIPFKDNSLSNKITIARDLNLILIFILARTKNNKSTLFSQIDKEVIRRYIKYYVKEVINYNKELTDDEEETLILKIIKTPVDNARVIVNTLLMMHNMGLIEIEDVIYDSKGIAKLKIPATNINYLMVSNWGYKSSESPHINW